MNRRTFLRLAGLSAVTLYGGITAHDLLAHAAALPAPFTVYLTFEGGPTVKKDGTGLTVDILDTLKKHNAAATFFLTGKNLHDYTGPILARMLAEGHAIGNRLYQAEGNTAADQATSSLLAEEFLKNESRIRALVQSSTADAADAYAKQAKLYRRPDGDTALGTFLDPDNYNTLAHEPFLKKYEDNLPWLQSVYDYSGWQISAGSEANDSAKKTTAFAIQRHVVTGGQTESGVASFLCLKTNNKRAAQVGQGLIVQLFDSDKVVAAALAGVIEQLRAKGAQFAPLPRTADQPNTFLLGVNDPPTADDSALGCNATVTATPAQTAEPTAAATGTLGQ